MRITVKLFAILRERAGTGETILELPAGATVAAAVSALSANYSAIAGLIGKSAFAVNLEYTGADRPLIDGDELALIPAVSGGGR